MKKSMNLIGQAISDYYDGKKYPFFLEQKGDKHQIKLDRYLRTSKELSKSEKKLISFCYGNILDVGCGTGNYIPAIEKKGKVIGIDISPKMIEVSKKLGIDNCFVGDIFSFESKKKFDTITMFENNLGLGKTIEGTKKLLRKSSDLLKEKGQILVLLSGRSKNNDFLETELTPIYRDIKGESFKWINFNPKYLSKLCDEVKMNLKIISSNKHYSLVKITKKQL
jgi:SAM-dependent methyltransferase